MLHAFSFLPTKWLATMHTCNVSYMPWLRISSGNSIQLIWFIRIRDELQLHCAKFSSILHPCFQAWLGPFDSMCSCSPTSEFMLTSNQHQISRSNKIIRNHYFLTQISCERNEQANCHNVHVMCTLRLHLRHNHGDKVDWLMMQMASNRKILIATLVMAIDLDSRSPFENTVRGWGARLPSEWPHSRALSWLNDLVESSLTRPIGRGRNRYEQPRRCCAITTSDGPVIGPVFTGLTLNTPIQSKSTWKDLS